jgi:hypothetical protein
MRTRTPLWVARQYWTQADGSGREWLAVEAKALNGGFQCLPGRMTCTCGQSLVDYCAAADVDGGRGYGVKLVVAEFLRKASTTSGARCAS